MISVTNNSNDPFFNLALEEYMLKEKPIASMILILWQSNPSVVIGRHQNPFAETDGDYLRENKIELLRRISGGGAVYHDPGNLNYTLIVDGSHVSRHDFLFFAGPVIRCLEQLGLKAEATVRNDLTVDGRKFSGSARLLYRNRILHHGTILFDSDLCALEKALAPQDEYVSRSPGSARSRVVNIREKLGADLDMDTFRQLLGRAFFSYHGFPFREYPLSDGDVAAARRLAEAKYRTWEWVYGRSPAFRVRKSVAFAGRRFLVDLTVEKGIITKCHTLTAGTTAEAAATLSRRLTGRRFDRLLTG